jgi:hypothetical protein
MSLFEDEIEREAALDSEQGAGGAAHSGEREGCSLAIIFFISLAE